MFESIQDFIGKEIDKAKLLENLSYCDEYINADSHVKEELDLFIEDIKEAKSDEEVIKLLESNFLFNLGIQPNPYKLLDLATRTNGGIIPVIDPGELSAFIDLCIEHEDDERLFRLAFNYNSLLFDKTKIEDYYIDRNNVFYVCELACNDLQGIHYDRLIEAMLRADDINELKYFAANISDKTVNINRILEKIKELDV